jgi:exopolysaccharide biosynthesis polyprenyl glycosylphosphotransferase
MSSTPFSGTTRLSTVIPFPAHGVTGLAGPANALRRAEFAITLVERLLDFAAVIAAVWTAYWLPATWYGGLGPQYSNGSVLITAAGFAVLMVLLLDKHGAYRPCLSLLAVGETERLLRVMVTATAFAIPILMAATHSIPHAAIARALLFVPLLVVLEKWQTKKAIGVIRDWGAITRKTVILGTGPTSRRVYSTLLHSPKFGLNPVAFVSECQTVSELVIYEESYRHERHARVMPGPVTSKLLRKLQATALIIAAAETAPEEITEIKLHMEAAGISTYIIPDPFDEATNATDYMELDGILLAHKTQATRRPLYDAAKRALDIGVASFLLALLSPMLAAAAIAVRLTSPGPALFTQQRVGQNGACFKMLKFRSMYVDCERYAYSPKSGVDPRITPIGRLLRRTCIDELPQLINILQGEMSLVGPRPEMPFIVEQYEAIHRQRLTVKPGLTGLWQLSADRRSLIHENISYDLYYIRRRNFLMDIAIMLHTLVFAFRGV